MSRVVDKHKLDVLVKGGARDMDAYWRAAKYLSVGQVLLVLQSALEETAQRGAREAAASRPTTPGLNFLYVHLNCLIRKDDLNVIHITGPGPRRAEFWLRMPIWRRRTARFIRTSQRLRKRAKINHQRDAATRLQPLMCEKR